MIWAIRMVCCRRAWQTLPNAGWRFIIQMFKMEPRHGLCGSCITCLETGAKIRCFYRLGRKRHLRTIKPAVLITNGFAFCWCQSAGIKTLWYLKSRNRICISNNIQTSHGNGRCIRSVAICNQQRITFPTMSTMPMHYLPRMIIMKRHHSKLIVEWSKDSSRLPMENPLLGIRTMCVYCHMIKEILPILTIP